MNSGAHILKNKAKPQRMNTIINVLSSYP